MAIGMSRKFRTEQRPGDHHDRMLGLDSYPLLDLHPAGRAGGDDPLPASPKSDSRRLADM